MTRLLWLNDRLLPDERASLFPEDRGFLLGDGLFETMRLVAGRVPRLDDHLFRLSQGASLLQIPLPDHARIHEGVDALTATNTLSDGSIRLTLTRGSGPRGLLPSDPVHPTVLMTITPQAAPQAPARLGVSRYRRDGASPLASLKTLNYLPQILTRLEAEQSGYDDALLLSIDGRHVAEASASNLVLLKGNTLITPPLRDGPLDGLSRSRLLGSGLCVEASVTLEDCCSADAAWLINSLSLRAVASIESRILAEVPFWHSRLVSCLFAA